mmetsp:Transcript_53955/g.108488  ORF Transcript_53955/g.108488 Transcript_53955/m.108488 type:complete len:151 (-) Transcript_53955:239-691(-)
MALAALFANRAANPGAPPHISVAKSAPKAQVPPPSISEYIDSEANLQAAVDRSLDSRLVILAFVVSFAPPCDTALANIQTLQTRIDNLEVVKVDCASLKGSLIADGHGIEATPTLRFYVGGKQVHTMTTISQDLIHPFVVKWSKKAQSTR